MLLIALATAWLLGIAIGALLPLPPLSWLGLALVGGSMAYGGWGKPRWRSAGLMLLVGALGALRLWSAQTSPPAELIQLADTKKVTLYGLIEQDPDRSSTGDQRVIISVERQGNTPLPEHPRILLTLPIYPRFAYGQRIVVTGTLRLPAEPDRPNAFDYKRYLARKGIFLTMREPQLTVLSERGGDPVTTLLRQLRERCRIVLLRSIPEPQAGVAIGVLLGLETAIATPTYDDFRASGTTHALVISGWNFSILAVTLAALLRLAHLRRRPRFLICTALIWLYALFVGLTPSVVRAALMATLTAFAFAVGRLSDAWVMLFAACWGMALLDPFVLWDVGAQLSVLCTAALLAISPFSRRLMAMDIPLVAPSLRELLATNIAAQFAALPLSAYLFGTVPLFGAPASLLVLICMPWAMLAGMLTLVFGIVWLPLGQCVGVIAWLPFMLITKTAYLFAHLPGALWYAPPVSLWLVSIYYLAFCALLGWVVIRRLGVSIEPEDE